MAQKQVSIAKLAAGTKTFVSYDYGVTFEKVKGITAVGDIGEMADTQETTTLEDTARTYIASLGTPANKQFIGNHYADDAGQAKFIEAAKNKQTVMIRIELPTYPKTIGTNVIALLGFQINGPVAENVIQFTIGGQASGKTIWSTNTDVDIQSLNLSALTNSVGIGGTLALQASFLPENATVTANQIVYEALNPAIATVANTGVITGVTSGDFGIRATDSVSGIETLWFGRVSATVTAPAIAAVTPAPTGKAGTAAVIAFSSMFTATASGESDYTVTINPAVPGASIVGGDLKLAASIAAGDIVVKAVHKLKPTVTATTTITVSA